MCGSWQSTQSSVLCFEPRISLYCSWCLMNPPLAGTAMVLATRRDGGVRAALAPGAVGGVAIFCGGVFSVLALASGVPGYVFFPMTNGGSALLVTVLSVLLLKEHLGVRGWAGVGVGAAALVLLGLAG